MLKSEWVSHQIENNICIFQIEGEIISTGIKEIDHYIRHYLENESLQGVIIDVQVQFVDSALVGCLMEQLKRFQKHNLKNAVCGLEEDVSHLFNNINLNQFAGIFSNRSEILRIWSRPQQRKIQRRALPKHEVDNTYYIVGPQKSWKLSHSSLIAIITLICSTFVFLIGIIVFQSLYFELNTANLNDELHAGNQHLDTLKEGTLAAEKKYYALKEQIEDKDISLSKIRLTLESETDQQWKLIKDRALYNKQIKEIQEDIKKKESQYDKMKSLNSEALNTIQSLTQKIEDIKKRIAIAELQAASAKPPAQTETIGVTLEKLKVNRNQNNIVVQFNLRNKTQGIRSGFIMVTLVNQNIAARKPLQFSRKKSQTYSIRRFRPFKIEFPISTDPSLDAISVTVWDNQQNQLIEQVLPFSSF